MYACGDTSGGKLGLGETAVQGGSATGGGDATASATPACPPLATPRRLLGDLQGHRVVKVAVHSGSRHALALTAEGRVCAWGDGGAGQLGLGDRQSHSSPRLMPFEDADVGMVIDIAVGSNYSAAVTARGELFTWGQGKSGRLGHGDTEDRLLPTKVCVIARGSDCSNQRH